MANETFSKSTFFSCIFQKTGCELVVSEAVVSATGRYLLTEQFRLNEQDLLALFERHGYDLVLLEGFGDSGWAKIEVVRSSVSPVGTAFQPMAIVGDVPGADFALDDPAALADWIENQMPSL